MVWVAGYKVNWLFTLVGSWGENTQLVSRPLKVITVLSFSLERNFSSIVVAVYGQLQPDMCLDPNHLFLWFQILTKIRKIYVVAYGLYIPLSPPSQFCPLPNQNFETNSRDPADRAEPWIQDSSGFLPNFVGFKAFHQINPLSYKTLWHGHWTISRNTQKFHRSSCFARIDV